MGAADNAFARSVSNAMSFARCHCTMVPFLVQGSVISDKKCTAGAKICQFEGPAAGNTAAIFI